MNRAVPQSEVPVAIVGAGPVGLALALGLARHGVRSVLVERKPSTSRRSKAPGIHVRTREVFRQWGIEERFTEAGVLLPELTVHAVGAAGAPLLSIDFSELQTEADRPGLLVLEQGETERLLLEAVSETGRCEVRFAAEAVGLEQDGSVVRLRVREQRGERTISAPFLVGCDGAGSFVRGALGLPFEGATYSLRPMLADVRIGDARDALAWPRLWNGRRQVSFAVRLRPGRWRVISIERREPRKEEVPQEEVQGLVDRLLGAGAAPVEWASRFRIHLRSSPHFRIGRVLLAGDAAHVHSPAGGFGMNGGIQDAHNLAWKLAAALGGGDLDRLLDSYEVERRCVSVEDVSRLTDLLTRGFLDAPAMVRRAVFLLYRLAMRSSRLRRATLRRMTMLDLDYGRSPLLEANDQGAGVRLPNPELRTPDGAAVRLYDLLPNAPLLIEVETTEPLGEPPVRHTLRIGRGGYQDASGLLRRLLGGKQGWILVRPDAHLAWAHSERTGMAEAAAHALGSRGR